MTRVPLLVTIVDDDVSVRESLAGLVGQLGFSSRTFSSAECFLASDCISRTACLVLDVGLPGMSGPALQKELVSRGWDIPIVFITGQVDECVRAALLGCGAVDCLAKPFSDADLARALKTALGDGGRA